MKVSSFFGRAFQMGGQVKHIYLIGTIIQTYYSIAEIMATPWSASLTLM